MSYAERLVAYEAGYADGYADAEMQKIILTDLIAELRDICYYGAESDICAAGILAERYEARLREAQGE